MMAQDQALELEQKWDDAHYESIFFNSKQILCF